MAGRAEFDGAKFKELVLYLAQASAEDEGFGMVKLNKLLYRSDFEAFRLLGRSMTGATYEKQEYGPVARELPLALDQLAERGYIMWLRPMAGPYVRKVPSAIEAPDRSLFTTEEFQIVDTALSELGAHGGKSVSEWSHETSAGWRVKQIGEAIPYSSAVINLKPLSSKSRASLRERLAARYA